MKLKMCSRPRSGSAGLAVSLLALLLVLLGGSLALRGQPNRQGAHRNGAAEALLGLGAIVFVALVASCGFRRGLLGIASAGDCLPQQ